MTANPNLKRLVRQRMRRTGESYTAALRVLKSRRREPVSTSQTKPAGQDDLVVTAMVTKTLHEQAVLRITGELPCSGGEIGAAIAEVDRTRQRQGLVMAGPPHFTCGPDQSGALRWEAGIPVGQPGTRENRVEPGVLPGSEVASIYYQGNFTRGAAVEDYLRREIAAAGLQPAGNPRWIYLTAPERTPDPDDHYSEVVCPVTRRPG